MINNVSDQALALYVYYKIPANQHTDYFSALNQLTDTIKKRYPFLKIQQEKRLDLDAENRETWMETYHNISSELLEKLRGELMMLANQHGLPNERKHEIFISLS